MKRRTLAALAVVLVAAGLCSAAVAGMGKFSGWSAAVRVEAIPGTDPSFNGPDLDGCPFISRDGKKFFMASNRPGGLGGIDIWLSTRARKGDPWGAPFNVGAPVNSSANDFCPTLARDGRNFYFVSNRAGGCGGADMYTAQRSATGSFGPVTNLGCQVNSSADEASPMPLREVGKGSVLYFSSTRPGGFTAEAPGALLGDSDLYTSTWDGSVFGPAALVPGANSAFEDGQPNTRRDGLELFFYSNRTGTLGMADIYAATRAKTSNEWSAPFNLGPNVNSAAAETRPSLSWDGTTLYYGSTRPGGEGSTDHYVTTREKLKTKKR
jgi:hypothetical protein